MPENLAPAEDVGKIARKLNKAITESAKKGG